MYVCITGTPIAKKRPRFFRKGNHVGTYNAQVEEEGRWLLELKHKIATKGYPLPYEGPLMVELMFFFKRPKSHYGTGKNADKLKASAPKEHTVKPDVDNLVKFCLDCMNDMVFSDDKQIISLKAQKSWSLLNEGPVTIINVQEVPSGR